MKIESIGCQPASKSKLAQNCVVACMQDMRLYQLLFVLLNSINLMCTMVQSPHTLTYSPDEK